MNGLTLSTEELPRSAACVSSESSGFDSAPRVEAIFVLVHPTRPRPRIDEDVFEDEGRERGGKSGPSGHGPILSLVVHHCQVLAMTSLYAELLGHHLSRHTLCVINSTNPTKIRWKITARPWTVEDLLSPE